MTGSRFGKIVTKKSVAVWAIGCERLASISA